MKKNINNKEYTIEETLYCFIVGYKKSKINKGKEQLRDILKYILEVAKENINDTEIKNINIDLSKILFFKWTLNLKDLMSYATCIFYVLINRDKNITDEEILKEFLTEIYSHHPRRTIKEAKFILNNIIFKYK